jgi:hypothetical protein
MHWPGLCCKTTTKAETSLAQAVTDLQMHGTFVLHLARSCDLAALCGQQRVFSAAVQVQALECLAQPFVLEALLSEPQATADIVAIV